MKYKVKVRRIITEESYLEVTGDNLNFVGAMNIAEKQMRDNPEESGKTETKGVWAAVSIKEEQ